MINKNIKKFAEEKWSAFLSSVSDLSRGKNRGSISLVEDGYLLYNLDKICTNFFASDTDHMPTSADALRVTNDLIEVIEFKSGFVRRITKENHKENDKGKCPHIGDFCDYYWDLFFIKQDKEQDNLKDSLKLKAVESYIFLEKHIFPHEDCQCLPQCSVSLNLKIVIDSDPVENEENMMKLLANQPTKMKKFEETRKGLKQALIRFQNKKDYNNRSYYYDDIRIMSETEYMQELARMKKLQ